MTLNELKSEVMKLGFEHDIDDGENLIICANRALKIMLAERKITKTVLLNTADYCSDTMLDSPFFEIDFTAIYPDFISFVARVTIKFISLSRQSIVSFDHIIVL